MQIVKRIFSIGAASAVGFGTYMAYFPLFFMQIPCYICKDGSNDNYTLLILTLYLLSDCLGRLIPLFDRLFRNINIRWLVVITYVKLPLCVTAALQVFPLYKNGHQPLIRSDVLTIITVILYPFLTTLSSTGIITKYQSLFNNDKDRSRASLILNVFMETGILIGCVLSIALIPVMS